MNHSAATAKQISFLTTLIGEKELTDLRKAVAVSFLEDPNLTKSQASAMITALMAGPRKVVAAATTAPAAEVPEGMHKAGDDIFKVQRAIHGSGNLYAKKLVRYDSGCNLGCGHGDCGHTDPTRYSTEFEYAPGAIRKLSAETAMSLEEAKEYGAVYGVCCVCARTLTNESSIEAGIGPICAGKF